ncbi:hypothetical protein PYCC9005_003579 [Savitreella phatthalungensis]
MDDASAAAGLARQSVDDLDLDIDALEQETKFLLDRRHTGYVAPFAELESSWRKLNWELIELMRSPRLGTDQLQSCIERVRVIVRYCMLAFTQSQAARSHGASNNLQIPLIYFGRQEEKLCYSALANLAEQNSASAPALLRAVLRERANTEFYNGELTLPVVAFYRNCLANFRRERTTDGLDDEHDNPQDMTDWEVLRDLMLANMCTGKELFFMLQQSHRRNDSNDRRFELLLDIIAVYEERGKFGHVVTRLAAADSHDMTEAVIWDQMHVRFEALRYVDALLSKSTHVHRHTLAVLPGKILDEFLKVDKWALECGRQNEHVYRLLWQSIALILSSLAAICLNPECKLDCRGNPDRQAFEDWDDRDLREVALVNIVETLARTEGLMGTSFATPRHGSRTYVRKAGSEPREPFDYRLAENRQRYFRENVWSSRRPHSKPVELFEDTADLLALKRDCLVVITNLVAGKPGMQDALREEGGLPLIMTQGKLAEDLPTLQQHAVFCLYNALEYNEASQREIEGMKPEAVMDNPILRQAGFQAFLDSQGRPRLRRIDGLNFPDGSTVSSDFGRFSELA